MKTLWNCTLCHYTMELPMGKKWDQARGIFLFCFEPTKLNTWWEGISHINTRSKEFSILEGLCFVFSSFDRPSLPSLRFICPFPPNVCPICSVTIKCSRGKATPPRLWVASQVTISRGPAGCRICSRFVNLMFVLLGGFGSF